jgi:hypothetical protein
MKVKELINLLSAANPDADVYIAPTPSINGWINSPLDRLGKISEHLPDVVIGCREETAFVEEMDLKFPRES